MSKMADASASTIARLGMACTLAIGTGVELAQEQ
jgi:hypothetical protein